MNITSRLIIGLASLASIASSAQDTSRRFLTVEQVYELRGVLTAKLKILGGIRLPNPGQDPAGLNYELASTKTINLLPQGSSATLDPKEGMAEWKTWTEHSAASPYSRHRSDAWMQGTITPTAGKNVDFDLHRIGAQHRREFVMLRIVSPAKDVTLTKFDDMQNSWIDVPVQSEGVWKGFFIIYPSSPIAQSNGAFGLGNRYHLTVRAADTVCKIEAAFLLYPPGTYQAEEEDGGTPPGDPSDLN